MPTQMLEIHCRGLILHIFISASTQAMIVPKTMVMAASANVQLTPSIKNLSAYLMAMANNVFKLISISEGSHVKKKKTTQRNFNLIVLGGNKGDLPHPLIVVHQEEKDLFFPSKNSANESFLTLYYSLSTPFLFLPFLEACFFPHSGRICMWLLWLHNVKCNSLLIPNKPIFAGKIFRSLFSKSITIITKLISLSGFLFPLSLRTLISLSICSCTSVCI